MDAKLEALNTSIQSEADALLCDKGLLRLLEQYGKSFVGGSYFLNVMTWRDLDIYIAGDHMEEGTFFELGKDLALRMKPFKMKYRNELIGKTEHLPQGYYWGCYTTFQDQAWKIDVWAISSKEFEQKQQEMAELKSQINAVLRMAILKLKNSVTITRLLVL